MAIFLGKADQVIVETDLLLKFLEYDFTTFTK